jgi:hypothetical protein
MPEFIPRAFCAFERHRVVRGILRDLHIFGKPAAASEREVLRED